MGCTSSAQMVSAAEGLGREEMNRARARHAQEEEQSRPARHPEVSSHGHSRGSSKHRPASHPPTTPREDFFVRIRKRPGDALGARLGNTDKGAVICGLQESGLVALWNGAHPDKLLRFGAIITEVNGITGYWSILEEISRPGVFNMKITEVPPKDAGSNWFEEIAKISRTLDLKHRSAFMLKLPDHVNFSILPDVRAGACGVDQCAICIENVSPDETLVQLPCQHAFHRLCAARWLSQSADHSRGKRQCCPLCCRKLVSTPDGGIGMIES